jgi:hypothetical protein
MNAYELMETLLKLSSFSRVPAIRLVPHARPGIRSPADRAYNTIDLGVASAVENG